MESTTNSTSQYTPNVDKKIRVVYWQLTASELAALKCCIEGYGWLADSARRTGLHVNTITKVIQRGYGQPETITKIRNILLG